MTPQTPTKLSNTPSHMTSSSNPFELEIGKTTLSTSSTVKKKLKTPTPFSGDMAENCICTDFAIFAIISAELKIFCTLIQATN